MTKYRTIIIDYNFLVNAHLRKIANEETCDFHKFVKNLSFYFELKIYSRRNRDLIMKYLEENDLNDNISGIISKKESCLLFLNLDSMNSLDFIVKSYYK